MTRNEKLDQLNEQNAEVIVTDGEYALIGDLTYAGGWVLNESTGTFDLKAKTVTRIAGRTIYVNQMPQEIEE